MNDVAYGNTVPGHDVEQEVDEGQKGRTERNRERRARPVPRISIQAFCEDQETASVLQDAANDRRLTKTHVTVQMGGTQSALAHYQNAPTPNLIILESVQPRDPMLQDLDRLAEVCDGGTKVIVIGHVNDVLLYRELLRRGVNEYLVAPLSQLQVMESISNLYNDPDSDPVGHVVAFIGAKGGSGSSTVCHNTAWAISEAIQSDVVIVDMDLPFGTAGLDFNQDPVQGIADALMAPDRMDEVLFDRLLSKCSDHLSLFAAPGTLDHEYDIDARSCEVVLDIVRQNVPYVAIDVPHMWTSWAKQILIQSDEIVITASPDLANLRNAKNLVDLLKASRSNDGLPHLVLNQVGMPKRLEIGPQEFANALEIAPQSVISFDSELFSTAANNGQMIEEVSKKAKATEQFRELAFHLTHRGEPKAGHAGTGSLFAPILNRLKSKKAGT